MYVFHDTLCSCVLWRLTKNSAGKVPRFILSWQEFCLADVSDIHDVPVFGKPKAAKNNPSCPWKPVRGSRH